MLDRHFPLPQSVTLPLDWTRGETECGHEYHSGFLPDGTLAVTVEVVDGKRIAHGLVAEHVNIKGE